MELRKATRTMATAMESFIQEVNGMRKEMTAWREERERNGNVGERRRDGKENESRQTTNDGERKMYEDTERRRMSDGRREVLQRRDRIYTIR